jgi:hypothetical protein
MNQPKRKRDRPSPACELCAPRTRCPFTPGIAGLKPECGLGRLSEYASTWMLRLMTFKHGPKPAPSRSLRVRRMIEAFNFVLGVLPNGAVSGGRHRLEDDPDHYWREQADRVIALRTQGYKWPQIRKRTGIPETTARTWERRRKKEREKTDISGQKAALP